MRAATASSCPLLILLSADHRANAVGRDWLHAEDYSDPSEERNVTTVIRTIIAAIWVAVFHECQQRSCEQVPSIDHKVRVR